MFGYFRKKKIEKYINGAKTLIDKVFCEHEEIKESVIESIGVKPESNIKYQCRPEINDTDLDSNVKYQYRQEINYEEIQQILENRFPKRSSNELTERIYYRDETFVDGVFNIIDKHGYNEPDVYKAAGIDRKLFSKIRSNRNYQPSKDTAIALSLALKLTLSQAKDLLSRAGYTFSHSNKRDIIIEYFFSEKIYDLFDLNEVLFSLNEKIIGR